MPPNTITTSAADGEAKDAASANADDDAFSSSSVDTMCNSARIAMPYGRCILPDYIERDVVDHGTPRFVLLSYVVSTTLLLSFAPFLPSVMATAARAASSKDEHGSPFLAGYHTGWDEDHGITWEWTWTWTRWWWPMPIPLVRQLNDVILGLLEGALGLSPTETLNLALWGTLFPFGLLFVADALSSCSGSVDRSSFRFRLDWPRSWETGNTQCYTDMFCEPTRVVYHHDHDGGSTRCGLVRRPGNTYSNAVYLFGAECVLLSAWREYSSSAPSSSTSNVFLAADVLFGVMLLILSVLSTIWHASNAPTSQYVDIWSMECCIIFLNVRIMSLGGLRLLRAGMMDRDIIPGGTKIDAETFASVCSFAIYAVIVASFGLLHYNKYQQRYLHGGCPFSGRVRLYNRGKIGGNNLDLDTLGVCLFAGLPIIYLVAPTAVQVLVLRSAGSVAASTIAVSSLIVGWSLRMYERFCLDGWPPMNWVRERRRRLGTKRHGGTAISNNNGRWWSLANEDLERSFLTAVAAVASPTAILHFFTGITLLAGYVHVRTLEQYNGRDSSS